MRKRRRFLIAALLALPLAALALAGCGAATEAPQPSAVAAQPTAVAAATQPPTAVPTELPPPTDTPAPTHTPLPTNTPEPTATPTPKVADNSACIACHTSEETLKAVAKVEATPESLSEGEG